MTNSKKKSKKKILSNVIVEGNVKEGVDQEATESPDSSVIVEASSDNLIENNNLVGKSSKMTKDVKNELQLPVSFVLGESDQEDNNLNVEEDSFPEIDENTNHNDNNNQQQQFLQVPGAAERRKRLR